jgi:uncharacterized protein (TIGR00106 family)
MGQPHDKPSTPANFPAQKHEFLDGFLELSVIPLGRGRSISADVADLVKIIDLSGLDYRLTATGTIIEGSWDELMKLAQDCHGEMRKKTERVITLMKVDDYADRTVRLATAVESVEKQLGKPVKK